MSEPISQSNKKKIKRKNKIVNPKTGKWILVNGPTHRKLLKEKSHFNTYKEQEIKSHSNTCNGGGIIDHRRTNN